MRQIALSILSLVIAAEAADSNSKETYTFGAMADGYYSWNRNQPRGGLNQIRLFDVNANLFSLSAARLSLERVSDPVGFHVELGAGRSYSLMHSMDSGPRLFQYLPQAYITWKPSRVQLDFGKFYTSAGAELFESAQNWNYSRSLLFCWALPAYHVGLRSSIPLHKHFSAGAQVVNGWNNLRDNNTGKTVGLTSALTFSKVSWYHNFYFGPEKPDTNHGWRHLHNTILILTPSTKSLFYLEIDHGVDRTPGESSSQWGGIAAAGRFQVSRKWFLSPRIDWLTDSHGFATGTPQRVWEGTLTAEFKASDNLSARWEYRRDTSNEAFFERVDGSLAHSQATFLIGLTANITFRR